MYLTVFESNTPGHTLPDHTYRKRDLSKYERLLIGAVDIWEGVVSGSSFHYCCKLQAESKLSENSGKHLLVSVFLQILR